MSEQEPSISAMKPTEVKNGTQILQAHVQTLYDFDKITSEEKEELETEIQDLKTKINSLYER